MADRRGDRTAHRDPAARRHTAGAGVRVVTRSAIRQEDRRLRLRDILAAVAAVVLGATIAWIVLTIQGMNHDLRSKDSDIAALAQQVKGLGATPVAGPSGSPGSPGKDGKSIVGPRGPKGDTGASGKP